MSLIEPEKVSLRTVRLRALAPKIMLFTVLGILAAAGLRAALAGPRTPVRTPAVHVRLPDQAAQSFAEAFTRAYLTWDSDNADQREQQLAAFPTSTDDAGGAGLTPGNDSQDVRWTAVVAQRRVGERMLVTVSAQTSGADGLVYLDVPVARDKRGMLYIAGYPALVGPPATASRIQAPTEDDVEDSALVGVAQRAVKNYLAGARDNLFADLAPGAVVSMPTRALRVTGTGGVTWVQKDRRVAVQVTAQDDAGATLTLRYELEVLKRDRWYVRSLQVDPIYPQGGS